MINRHKAITTVLVPCLFFGAVLQANSDSLVVAENNRIDLRRAITLALENNPVLEEAQLNLDIARGQVKEAWSNVLPSVSASASYSRSIVPQSLFLPGGFAQAFGDSSSVDVNEQVAVQIGADNVYAAGVTVSQPIFDFRAFIGVGTSARFRDLQVEVTRGTTQLVVTQVRTAYLNTLLAGEQVRLTEQSLERVRQTLKEARALNRSGLTSDYDVLRLEVQESNLDANLHRARVLEAASRRNLLVELGLPLTRELVLEGNLSELDLQDFSNNSPANLVLLELVGFHGDPDPRLEPVFRDALAHRSDLRQIQLTTSLERARLSAQRSEYFPTMSVFYNHNFTAQQMGAPDLQALSDVAQAEFALAGVNLEFPLFQGFRRTARMQQRRAAVNQSEVRHRRFKQLADSQVRTLLSNLQDSHYRAESQRKAMNQARRGYEIATAEYRSGVGSQLQITDAEVALRQAEFNYSSTVYEYLIVRTQLDAATGAVPITLAELGLEK
ncbi:MAG: TolC family protein [Candidatus Neomarinimicrobiota bacterium]